MKKIITIEDVTTNITEEIWSGSRPTFMTDRERFTVYQREGTKNLAMFCNHDREDSFWTVNQDEILKVLQYFEVELE